MLIIDQAYQKSIELLKHNSLDYGFLASGRSDKSLERGYNAVFSRDSMICALGALACNDEKLITAAKQSLSLLANNVTHRGQIPFAVNLERNLVKFRIPHSIDSTLWWLILFWLITEYHGDKYLKAEYQEIFEKCMNWIHYSINYGLLEQGEGADWADEMPRSGLVLYSNALWLIFIQLINSKEKKHVFKNFEYFFSSQKLTEKGYKDLDKQFSNWRKNRKKYLTSKPFYLAAVSRVTVDQSFDILGNILACMSGLVPQHRIVAIINEIKKVKASTPVPIRVTAYPIAKKKPGIFEISHQNKPWCYHNAGAWPMAGGFWVYLLAQQKQIKVAKQELNKLAEANYVNNWEFNEWFHGKSGRPMGVKHQSWNAATYILAYQAVINNKFII